MQQGIMLGLTATESEKLTRLYGSNVTQLFTYLERWNTGSAVYGLPAVLLAQLQYSILHEMTVTPADFFVRRTGALFFQIDWVRQWENTVWTYMANELHWSRDQAQQYRQQMRNLLREANEQQIQESEPLSTDRLPQQ